MVIRIQVDLQFDVRTIFDQRASVHVGSVGGKGEGVLKGNQYGSGFEGGSNNKSGSEILPGNYFWCIFFAMLTIACGQAISLNLKASVSL
jgi:hypothetical protein